MFGKTVPPAWRGGNFLHGFHDLTPGGPFDQAVQALGLTHIRFPGGSLTEELTLEQLAEVFPEHRVTDGVNLWTMLDYCRARGLRLWVVLPTEPFTPISPPFTVNEPEVRRLGRCIHRAIAHYPGQIAGLTIGNEYWAEEAQPDRYLAMANRWLAMGRNQAWPVRMLIQTAPFWRPWAEQNAIRHGIRADLRARVDGTDQHIYGRDELSFDRAVHFERMRSGEIGLSSALGYKPDLMTLVSEWGAGGENGGWRAPYALHRMLDQLLRHEVDCLCAWPVAYRYSAEGGGPAQLAGWNWEGKLYLTPAGLWHRAVFDRIMGAVRVPAPDIQGAHTMAFAHPAGGRTLLVAAGEAGVSAPLPGGYYGASVTAIDWTENPLIFGAEPAHSGAILGTSSDGAGAIQLAPWQTAIIAKDI